MILTVLFFLVTATNILIHIWVTKKKPFNRNIREDLDIGSSVMILLGSIAIFACVVSIIYSHTCIDKKIYTKQLLRESIIKQLEMINNDYEDISQSTVIGKVYEYNKIVYDTKYWAANPWTNWFYDNEYVQSLEFIEMED